MTTNQVPYNLYSVIGLMFGPAVYKPGRILCLLDRITINDCGSLQDQSLNLSAKEKLTEKDVQAY